MRVIYLFIIFFYISPQSLGASSSNITFRINEAKNLEKPKVQLRLRYDCKTERSTIWIISLSGATGGVGLISIDRRSSVEIPLKKHGKRVLILEDVRGMEEKHILTKLDDARVLRIGFQNEKKELISAKFILSSVHQNLKTFASRCFSAR